MACIWSAAAATSARCRSASLDHLGHLSAERAGVAEQLIFKARLEDATLRRVKL